MADKVRDGMRSFLRITPATRNTFTINETLDFQSNVYKNRIWYRGDADELSQFYKSMQSDTSSSKFWAVVPTKGRDIRKIHTGLPSMMIDVLTNIVMADLNDITILPESFQDTWRLISSDNNFTDIVGNAITDTLVSGDGAFKISFNTSISEYPIIEFVPGEFVDFKYERGRLKEIIFKTIYNDKSDKEYVLYESYGQGYIHTELKHRDKEVDLRILEETKDLARDIYFDGFIMAVPLMFIKSNKWKGRGKSVIDNKSDAFDAYDECWSQWVDAVRQGRATKYIPESMLPRNPYNGEVLKPNSFDNSYIQHDQSMKENDSPKIEVIQPAIPVESYISTYITALDICLQGVISPSTLGIDTKKLDNAEAQREKEKTTLYTRQKIVDALQTTLPKLIDVVFKAYNTWLEKPHEDIGAEIPFGEYANPSFESQIETVSKGKQGGVMSLEAAVEELYGDSKEPEWKAEEVVRLKAEQGISSVDEPIVADNLTDFKDTNTDVMSVLNGAQVSSLMNVIAMVKSNQLTRNEAINIITSTLGITRDNAETFIENGTL